MSKLIEQRIIEKANWATEAWETGTILLSEYVEELSQVKEMAEVLAAFDEADDWNSYINAIWSCDGLSDHVYHNLLINE